MCLDNPDDLEIYGNTLSGFRKNLYVTITKCTESQSSDNCKSDEEIDEALRGATLSVAYSQVKFDHTEYGESSVKSSHNNELF